MIFTLFIQCILMKLKAYVTPTNALFYNSCMLLHSSYMFQHYYLSILTTKHTHTYCDLLHCCTF